MNENERLRMVIRSLATHMLCIVTMKDLTENVRKTSAALARAALDLVEVQHKPKS